jgi:hypothetical protein
MLRGYSAYSGVTLIATYSASGTVNPTIFLSASPGAGGTVIGNGTFASGSSRTVTATANSGYTFANWTESGAVVSSSASYTFTLNGNRNLVANFTVITSDVPPLQNGVAVTGIAGAASSQKFYKITVPSGQSTLTISTSGGSGDCDLYVRRGSQPTTGLYDYRPYVSGNNETVTVNNPVSGDWYVMLNGYSAYSGVTLLANYSGVVDYPGASWIAAGPGHFTSASRVQADVTSIVIHTTEDAYYGAAIAWFQNTTDPLANTSAHYLVQRNGSVVQLVREKDIAHHAGVWLWNQHSIGIEVERLANATETITSAQYSSVKNLIDSIRTRFNVPLVFPASSPISSPTAIVDGIVGHGKAVTNGIDPVKWNWPYFQALFIF